MIIRLHYSTADDPDKIKELEASDGSEFTQILAKFERISHFHNTSNTIWRVRGIKDGSDTLLGYFVTDRNKHHKYTSPFEKLQLLQISPDIYAAAEKFESINVDSLGFLDMLNDMKLNDQRKPQTEIKKFDRVISSGDVRFGCGYSVSGKTKVYYAWHGLANRGDHYITTAEISETEFHMIESEYPCNIKAEKDTAAVFRKKYVHGHKVLLEGWGALI